jgi:guanylate kinase
MDAGTDVVLEIDVQGAFQVRGKVPEARLVFIAPPSPEELERRLRGRGTDSPESIATRLENARAEMDAADDYDVVVVNDDLEQATEELLAVLES